MPFFRPVVDKGTIVIREGLIAAVGKFLFIDGRAVPLDCNHTELVKQFNDRP